MDEYARWALRRDAAATVMPATTDEDSWGRQRRQDVPFRTGRAELAESFCSASRTHWLARHGEGRVVDVAFRERLQRLAVAPESIAYALGQIGSECAVTFAAWPDTHARVALPNGWVVSVAFGPHAHCDNSPTNFGSLAELEWSFADLRGAAWAETTRTAELAIFTPDEAWFAPHDERVWGYVGAQDLQRVVDAVGTTHHTGACPCPDCVRA